MKNKSLWPVIIFLFFISTLVWLRIYSISIGSSPVSLFTFIEFVPSILIFIGFTGYLFKKKWSFPVALSGFTVGAFLGLYRDYEGVMQGDLITILHASVILAFLGLVIVGFIRYCKNKKLNT